MLKIKDWSYSRYGTWKQCPAKLKFAMEDKGPRVSHPAAERGTGIHKMFENYLLGEFNDLSTDFSYYIPFLEALKAQKAVPEMPIALDVDWKPVAWDAPNRWWRGVLDCVVQEPEVVHVYDWKTGNEYADHREQREIYAAAVHSIIDVPYVRVFHVYVDKKQNTTTLFHRDDMPDLKESWKDRVAPMFADEAFVPNPGWHCRSCQYRSENGGPCPF